jgi:hypothetical protein
MVQHRITSRFASPVLREVLALAKRQQAAICVARLDRLSRDVAFISGLMAQQVPFVVAELGRMRTRSCCTSMLPSRSKSAA